MNFDFNTYNSLLISYNGMRALETGSKCQSGESIITFLFILFMYFYHLGHSLHSFFNSLSSYYGSASSWVDFRFNGMEF